MTNAEILGQIPQLTQSQYSLDEQLRLVQLVTNKLGCYDAADFIGSFTQRMTR